MSDMTVGSGQDVVLGDVERAALSRDSRAISRLVAVTIIMLSVFMAVAKVKDDNIVQAMQQTKTDVVDTWAEYQAAKFKQHIADEALGRDVLLATVPGVDVALVKADKIRQQIASDRYQVKAGELLAKARAGESRVEQLSRQDDQFDMSDTLLAIALAIGASSILAESYLALVMSWVVGAAGMVMGAVGFIGGSLRIEWLINLLN
jgi:Domain of unknown function (DUF4337)